MINELRTCLGNIPGPVNFARVGSEYVSPEARRKVLPESLRHMHRYVFGANPDWFMSNYRLRQLLPVIEKSKTAEVLSYFDPRVTYNLDQTEALLFTPYVGADPSTAAVLSGPETIAITPSEADASPDASGRCWAIWRLTCSDTSYALNQIEGGVATAEGDLVSDIDGFTLPIRIPGTAFTVRVPNSSVDIWDIRVVKKPQRTLGELLTWFQTAGRRDLDALWIERDEVHTFCRTLFLNGPDFGDRLAAALVAMAWGVRNTPLA